MINLDETLELLLEYSVQRDFFLKGILYIFSSIIILDLIREQIPEVSILQLIPGFYLFLLFTLFFLAAFFFDIITRYPLEFENEKNFGIKTTRKINASSLSNSAYTFFIITFLIAFNTVIPISLDSFNSYGEQTIENIWSFDQVLNVETLLLTVLFFISQLPVVFLIIFKAEKERKNLFKFWKIIIFLIVVFSGILTPTIEGSTQLGFVVFADFNYLILLFFLEKRINTKFNGVANLGC